jgi:hypothetical protein
MLERSMAVTFLCDQIIDVDYTPCRCTAPAIFYYNTKYGYIIERCKEHSLSETNLNYWGYYKLTSEEILCLKIMQS